MNTKSLCSAVNSVVDGGRPKICHINTPLQPMAPPWRESLHKLAMAVVKKPAMPFRHSGTLATI